MKFWIFMAATIGLDWIAISFAKKYILSDDKLFLAGATLCFVGMLITMIQMFKLENIAIANSMWAGLSAVGVVLIGVLYFGEKISSLQTIGIILIVSGVILLELPR